MDLEKVDLDKVLEEVNKTLDNIIAKKLTVQEALVMNYMLAEIIIESTDKEDRFKFNELNENEKMNKILGIYKAIIAGTDAFIVAKEEDQDEEEQSNELND